MKGWLAFFLICIFSWVSPTHAQLFQLEQVPQYDFVNYKSNQIWTPDSTSLSGFYDALWQFESKDSGKIRIMHLGDSHIQAGFFTATIRENLHQAFGCGTRERGFVFPYGLARTNGPLNYGVKFTGNWRGNKSISDNKRGLSGINAFTSSDSASLKMYSNNKKFESHYFDKVKLFFKNDSNCYRIKVKGNGVKVVNQEYYPSANCMEYYFDGETDSVFFDFIISDTFKGNDDDLKFTIQGVALENNQSGITYSEIGTNGALLATFLNAQKFGSQLNIMHPDLMIISLGTNDIIKFDFNDTTFFNQYDTLLNTIKKSLPKVQVILTTPPDFKKNRIIPVVENILVRKRIIDLAKKHNCGIWDFHQIMGGVNSIDDWYKEGLTANDKIHFNVLGYELKGMLFFNALMQGYENYSADLRSVKITVNEGRNWAKAIEDFLTYNPKKPWVYSNSYFWIAFLVVFFIYSFIYDKTKLRSWYLLAFSLFFYYKSSGFYFSILIFSTLIDFVIGNQVYKSQSITKKKLWVALSITINLLILGFFKYSFFVIELLNGWLGSNLKVVNFFSITANKLFSSHYDIHEIFLPVGISFFTFQTISYSVDIYRSHIKPTKSLIDFGFFVSFFPQLVAGPIVRAKEFIPQIHQKYQLSKQNLSLAITLILGGLCKKIIISDYLSTQFVDRVFENPFNYSGLENLVGIYGYAIQIYCDFSAYSDIAIGLALIMGFQLPSNFDSPYKAINITDFWRRWHQSLSRWLKDYLYISLGGNRKGKFRTYINLMITMLLGGLWHGAALKFIIWGGLHGMALVVHKLFMRLLPNWANSKSWWINLISGIVTFHFVCFCWILFRISDLSKLKVMMNQIMNNFILNSSFLTDFIYGYYKVLLILFLGLITHFIPDLWMNKLRNTIQKTGYIGYVLLTILIILVLYQFKTSETLPFIYFNF